MNLTLLLTSDTIQRLTLREFELVIGIAEHVSDIHVSANIQKVKLKNVGQIQKSMGPFEKMPLL